jgi:DNA topoisomerase-6 subunit B
MASKSASSVLRTKSPAEFFAENQNIAGFDNPGKSMYTTVREFVEVQMACRVGFNPG